MIEKIYGLVHSARESYEKFVDVLKGLDFVKKKSDPYLLWKWEDNLMIA
jgi:hypothetical protein